MEPGIEENWKAKSFFILPLTREMFKGDHDRVTMTGGLGGDG